MKTKKKLLILGLIAAVSVTALRALADDGSAITNPSWKDSVIGHVNYSYRGDQRTRDENINFRINEDGWVEGHEILDLAHPAERALFEQVMHARGSSGNTSQLYQQYLQQLTDQALGLLVLNRIIDHEAMKRKMQPDVSDERVEYVMRAVFTQNALNKRKRCSTGDDLSICSNQEMYGWLQETIGANAVRFNMDWSFTDGGLGLALEGLRSHGELDWPAVSISFDHMPGSWQEFRDQIKQKLHPSYRQLMRTAVWRRLVEERNPLLSWQSMFSVRTDQMQLVYQAMRDTMFKVENLDSTVSEIVAHGPRAAAFRDAFKSALTQRQQQLLTQLFGSSPSGATSDADADRLKQQVIQLRGQVPREVYGQISAQFASDIAAGNLRVSMSDRSMHHSGTDDLPTDDSVSSQETRAAFNPMFAAMSLFPEMDAVDSDQSVRILLLRNQAEGSPTYLDIHDSRVERVLRQKLIAKTQGNYFRQLAFDLFRENGFEFQTNTCSGSDWPCANNDPRRWAELIFPETLYPNMTLPSDGPGQPSISSTLGRSEYLDRVLEISTDLFERVMEIPNEHVDNDIRFHNY